MNIKSFEYYNENYDLCVVYKNVFSQDTDMFANHSHKTYEIYYLRDGQRNFFIRGKLNYIKAPSLVIIAPTEGHYTAGNYPCNYSSLIINMNLNIIPKYLLGEEDFKPLRECSYDIFNLSDEDVAVFDRIIKEYEKEVNDKNCGFQLNIYTHTLSLVTQILKLYAAGKSARYSESMTHTQHTIKEVILYISTHYAEDLSLEMLSNKFFISSWHLSRSFKMVTGMSLHAYVNKTRLNNAKNILDNHRHTKLSVIAQRCGFKSESSFIRAFKNYMGITPHQYRKNKVITSGKES